MNLDIRRFSPNGSLRTSLTWSIIIPYRGGCFFNLFVCLCVCVGFVFFRSLLDSGGICKMEEATPVCYVVFSTFLLGLVLLWTESFVWLIPLNGRIEAVRTGQVYDGG